MMSTRRMCVWSASMAALLLTGSVAQADPTGTMYNWFMDTNVTDGVGTAIENHSTFGNSLTFDGIDELVPGGIIDFEGGTYNDANPWWVGEQVTDLGNGESLLQFWAFGDDDELPHDVPPASGNYGPLFTNAIVNDGVNVVNWGLESLYWAGLLSDSGEYAEVIGGIFLLTFDGGGAETGVEIFPVDFFTSGLGTEDNPLFLFFMFDPADFANDPTDFHVVLAVRHVPEPASLALCALGGLALLRRGRTHGR